MVHTTLTVKHPTPPSPYPLPQACVIPPESLNPWLLRILSYTIICLSTRSILSGASVAVKEGARLPDLKEGIPSETRNLQQLKSRHRSALSARIGIAPVQDLRGKGLENRYKKRKERKEEKTEISSSNQSTAWNRLRIPCAP